MRRVVFGLLLSLSLAAHTQTEGWITRDGKPAPNSDAMKSMNGFGGWLVVTPDRDWEEKWNTSPEAIPEFREARDVSYGEELTILIFYTNPKTHSSGEFDVLCDLKVTKPDGGLSTDAKGVQCAGGKLEGNPHNVRLSSTIIKYIGESGDPPGNWIVEVTLVDRVRDTTIPLKTHFNLRGKTNKAPNASAGRKE